MEATHQLGRYKLLASAIAGRVVDVAPASPGAPAWTDGATVFVDASAPRSAQLAGVSVQAALLGAGSLTRDVAGKLHRSATIRRYLGVEGHRALAANEATLPPAVRALLDPSVAERTDSPAASLLLATGRGTIDDPPELFGTIHPKQLRSASADVDDNQTDPRPQSATVSLRELDEDEDDDRDFSDFLSSPVGGSGAIGKLLKRMFGDARSAGSGPPGADAPTRWSRRATRTGGTVALTTAIAVVPDGDTFGAPQDWTYPEWDVHRRQYRPHWCVVSETEVGPEACAPLGVPDTHAYRRPLARIGMELERSRRQPQGDEIDIDAAVEARVDAIAGVVPDEGLYVDTLRRRRDLAVLILLDISGSSGEPGAAGGSVHEHQRDTAAALMIALHEHGDRVALYGFRSQGRSAVRVIPAKRFGDGVDRLAMQRLGGFVPGGYTRVGAAIRHGAAVLDREAGTTRRLLVVVSDGFAYDHGYEGAYGVADARRALAESRRAGTGCVCLSVGSSTDVDALRRIFGTAAHASTPRAELVPGVIGPLFRAALRSAEAQRRVAVRRERAHERLVIERSPA